MDTFIIRSILSSTRTQSFHSVLRWIWPASQSMLNLRGCWHRFIFLDMGIGLAHFPEDEEMGQRWFCELVYWLLIAGLRELVLSNHQTQNQNCTGYYRYRFLHKIGYLQKPSLLSGAAEVINRGSQTSPHSTWEMVLLCMITGLWLVTYFCFVSFLYTGLELYVHLWV